jgi:hypothetical protein
MPLKEESIDAIKKSIKDAENSNKEYQEQKSKYETALGLKKELEALANTANNLTNTMDEREKKKLDLLTKIKLPIEGLTFKNKIIRYDGTALNECSTSTKMKVSFAIGMALNPRLKVIFMRNAALLDNGNLKVIRDLAQEKGYCLWLELLEHKNKSKNIMQVMIEDGEVV